MNTWLTVQITALKLRIARSKLVRQDDLLGDISDDFHDAQRGKRAILREIKRLEVEHTKVKADLMAVRAIAPRRRFPWCF